MTKESLTLKWGTLKGWELDVEGPAFAALKRYAENGMSMSAAMQHDTSDQKQALCDLIDALDADTVRNDWEGTDMTKDEAKRYVMEYGK